MKNHSKLGTTLLIGFSSAVILFFQNCGPARISVNKGSSTANSPNTFSTDPTPTLTPTLTPTPAPTITSPTPISTPPITPPPDSSSGVVFPTRLDITEGTKNEWPLSNLMVMDSFGTSRDFSKYIVFHPAAGGKFAGEFFFTLPTNAVSSLKIDINYKGSTLEQQEWSFSIFNHTSGAYEKFANNVGVQSWVWIARSYSFTNNPSQYIGPGGEINIRYNSAADLHDSGVDYFAIIYTK